MIRSWLVARSMTSGIRYLHDQGQEGSGPGSERRAQFEAVGARVKLRPTAIVVAAGSRNFSMALCFLFARSVRFLITSNESNESSSSDSSLAR